MMLVLKSTGHEGTRGSGRLRGNKNQLVKAVGEIGNSSN